MAQTIDRESVETSFRGLLSETGWFLDPSGCLFRGERPVARDFRWLPLPWFQEVGEWCYGAIADHSKSRSETTVWYPFLDDVVQEVFQFSWPERVASLVELRRQFGLTMSSAIFDSTATWVIAVDRDESCFFGASSALSDSSARWLCRRALERTIGQSLQSQQGALKPRGQGLSVPCFNSAACSAVRGCRCAGTSRDRSDGARLMH